MSRRAREIPGPGHYQVADVYGLGHGGPAVKFGASRILRMQAEQAPGPGEYTPNGCCSKSSPRCLFGMSSRFRAMQDDAPGPGEYTPRDPNIILERRTIGTKSAVLPELANASPGPGAYSPPMLSQCRGALFGKQPSRWAGRNFGMAIDSPGPAAYQDQCRGISRRAPVACFSTSPRLGSDDSKWTSQIPGPGTYTWNKKSRAPKITITPRRDIDF
mmetsp:Transcript_45642/g.72916  ORF Transcript_45642/g.72916 Transcript_45642/m.72916 type:complete len:216 (+) Transcript_45642:64-711(+)